MANATFNAGIDYFGLETATSNALKVKSSAENRSKQSASGANCYGDIRPSIRGARPPRRPPSIRS